MKKIFTTLFAMAVMTAAFSQVLFEENFDDAGADLRWNVSEDEAGGDNSADFFYDYVAAGIPAAPNGGGLGLKFESNISEGLASQIYAFPADQTFSGRYIVSFDLWMATDTAGSGTTEFAIFGVMHTDEVVPSVNGVDYAFTGENGSARDIRVYEEGVELLATDGEGGYRLNPVDGSMLQNMNLEDGVMSPYQESFEGEMPFGQWLQVDIYVTPEDLTWTMNDSIWSSMPNLLGDDGNISIGYMDIFSSVADPTGSMFGLYDNVVVSYYPGTGVEENKISSAKIYPNPVSSYLQLEMDENASFELINSAGQLMISRKVEAGTSTIDFADVNNGIYFGRFIMESGATEVHKIIVNK